MKKFISIVMLLFVIITPEISYSQSDFLKEGLVGLLNSNKNLGNLRHDLITLVDTVYYDKVLERNLILNIALYSLRLEQICMSEVQIALFSGDINDSEYNSFYKISKGRIDAYIDTIERIKVGLTVTKSDIENSYIKDHIVTNHIVTIQDICDIIKQSLMKISIGYKKS